MRMMHSPLEDVWKFCGEQRDKMLNQPLDGFGLNVTLFNQKDGTFIIRADKLGEPWVDDEEAREDNTIFSPTLTMDELRSEYYGVGGVTIASIDDEKYSDLISSLIHTPDVSIKLKTQYEAGKMSDKGVRELAGKTSAETDIKRNDTYMDMNFRDLGTCLMGQECIELEILHGLYVVAIDMAKEIDSMGISFNSQQLPTPVVELG